MAQAKDQAVTMRIRVGDNELEVTGPVAFVEKKIAAFVEQHKGLPQDKGERTKETGGDSGLKGTKSMSIAQLFKKAAPGTDRDRALVAGYFLERFGPAEAFTASEVRQAIRGAKRTPPKNVNDSINGNIRKGMMMASGDKEGMIAFALTSDGIDAVEAMLKG